ncbi:MAG: hypothetical protein WCX96_03185 [Bacilli bacterium]
MLNASIVNLINKIVIDIIKDSHAMTLRFLPEFLIPGGDIDILVSSKSYKSIIKKIPDILLSNSCLIVQMSITNNTSTIYFIIRHNNLKMPLILDIRTDIIKQGYWLANFEFFKAHKMLYLDENNCYNLSPESEAAFLLCRNTFDDRRLDLKHKQLLKNLKGIDIQQRLEFFPIKVLSDITNTPILDWGGYLRPDFKLSLKLKRYKNKIKNVFNITNFNTPKHIALLGPDGVGKTTIAINIHELLSPFGKVTWLHYYQNVNSVEVNNNNEKIPKGKSLIKNLIDSTNMGIFLSFLIFMIRRHYKMLRDYSDNRFIVHDRFLVDYFLKKNRKRNISISNWFSHFFRYISADKMALQIVLQDHSGPIILRKPELSGTEIDWIYNFLTVGLSSKYKNVIFLDITKTNNSEEVVELCIENISNKIISSFKNGF